MIKLQLLLRHPGAEPELDAGLRARLEQHGFTIDGSGRASVSVHLSEAAFGRLFAGPAPVPGTPGAPGAGLAVPPGLQQDISLITCAPRHVMTHPHPRFPHAPI